MLKLWIFTFQITCPKVQSTVNKVNINYCVTPHKIHGGCCHSSDDKNISSKTCHVYNSSSWVSWSFFLPLPTQQRTIPIIQKHTQWPASLHMALHAISTRKIQLETDPVDFFSSGNPYTSMALRSMSGNKRIKHQSELKSQSVPMVCHSGICYIVQNCIDENPHMIWLTKKIQKTHFY